MKKIIITTTALLLGTVAFAAQTTDEEAAKFYQEQNWDKAAEAYQQIVADAPLNYRAWFRLGNAHIQLGEGGAALKALERAAENTSLPPVFLHYALAQAHHLNRDSNSMWKALDQAITAGYANLSGIEQDPIFADLKDSDAFQKVLQRVDMNARPCAFDDRYKAFDFWLGKWEVYGNLEKTGPLFGHNTIRKAENDCLITEEWLGASGSTGRSMNYYDGTIDQWVQRWVSGSGVVIDYSGGLVDGAMQLTGKIYYPNAEPKVRDFRGTWSSLEKGVVRQFFEESTDGGASWYTWFDGYYFPLKDE